MRPTYHYAPEKNWINDPNGLCQVDGVYHMYFQYNPNDSVWGDIHWGHAVSKDLLHWETRPIAMYPMTELGEKHCYSGGCCKDEKGRPHFFYTSIGEKTAGRGDKTGAQQWFAEAADDGLDRLVQTPEGALTGDIHGGLQVLEWRDPCVLRWKGQYLMVLGGKADERGCALLYTSDDLRHWTYRHILVQAEENNGIPFECPNLFPVDGKVALLYSPYGPVEALVGTLDEELHFHVETHEVLDPAGRGGFYAPQVFTDERGRVILQGWMPEGDSRERGRQRGYSGCMNLPRFLSVRDGFLYSEPMASVWTLAQEGPVGDSRHFLAEIACDRAALPLKMTFLSSDKGEETTLTLTETGELCLHREKSSLDPEADCTDICRTVRLEDQVSLFLSVDGTAIECGVNGQWLSGRAYPTGRAGGFETEAQGTISLRTGVI